MVRTLEFLLLVCLSPFFLAGEDGPLFCFAPCIFCFLFHPTFSSSSSSFFFLFCLTFLLSTLRVSFPSYQLRTHSFNIGTVLQCSGKTASQRQPSLSIRGLVPGFPQQQVAPQTSLKCQPSLCLATLAISLTNSRGSTNVRSTYTFAYPDNH